MGNLRRTEKLCTFFLKANSVGQIFSKFYGTGDIYHKPEQCESST